MNFGREHRAYYLKTLCHERFFVLLQEVIMGVAKRIKISFSTIALFLIRTEQ